MSEILSNGKRRKNILLWEQFGIDVDGQTSLDLSGRSVSINASGNIIAVGAPHTDSVGTFAGSVRVYISTQTTPAWTLLGSAIAGVADGEEFGWDVSLNAAGNILAVGARRAAGGGTQRGVVRIYSYNIAGTWDLLSTINGTADNDWFGSSVALNAAGDRIAIGSPTGSDTGSNSGVKVYANGWGAAAGWNLVGAAFAGGLLAGQPGKSLRMNAAGDRVIVGCPLSDTGATDAGTAKVF